MPARVDNDGRVQVDSAVAQIEEREGIGIAVIVARVSDRYALYPLAWAVVTALVTATILALILPEISLSLGLLILFAVLIALGFCFELKAIRMNFVPHRLKQMRARQLAHREFAIHALTTESYGGAVIFRLGRGTLLRGYRRQGNAQSNNGRRLASDSCRIQRVEDHKRMARFGRCHQTIRRHAAEFGHRNEAALVMNVTMPRRVRPDREEAVVTTRAALGAVICASIVALMLSVPALCATPKFPALTGRVVDDANILSPAARDQLTAMLARHEQETGQQVVVVTLASLQGYPIEDFGYQLGRYWGIGQKGKNTGALLIVAPKERKVRIEVGYGLEGQLTDAQSRIIIERDILPAFRQGNYSAGVVAGTAAVLKTLGGSADVGETANTAPSLPIADSPWVIPILLGGWGLFLLFRRAIAGPSGTRGIRRSRGPIYFPGGPYPPGGGFPSGGGGGGGFSGGGGSFGGGGASGSW